MQITTDLRKTIAEVKYLNVDNTDRYRVIIRYFYEQYEKLQYWLYPEEVFDALTGDEYFSTYTFEQCQQDLLALKEWKNLIAMQDTKKVATVEEFKNKKFRYQLSEFSVEIERMVIRLENLKIEGTSLEPTLMERIRQIIMKFNEVAKQTPERVHGWWSELNNNFILLNQNYQDYMRDLNSLKAEEMMKTKAFLAFKDTLIEYLRGFVRNLQYNVGIVEAELKGFRQETIDTVLEKVVIYELSIPRLEIEIDKAELAERIRGRYASIRRWFAGEEGQEAEAEMVFDLANDIIRKITRYAAQISEQTGSNANRKSDYAKVAEMFWRCKDMDEAHKLSAAVFGFDTVMHLKGDFPRQTESINSGVYDEKPNTVRLVPRTRTYREKSEKSPIVDHTEEKQKAKEEAMRRIERERELLKSYIKDNRLSFRDLPIIEPEVRQTFLMWMSKALETASFRAKTEDGIPYIVRPPKGSEYCEVECTDGIFHMPAYEIEFEGDEAR